MIQLHLLRDRSFVTINKDGIKVYQMWNWVSHLLCELGSSHYHLTTQSHIPEDLSLHPHPFLVYTEFCNHKTMIKVTVVLYF